MSRLTIGIALSILLMVLGIGCSNSSNPIDNISGTPEVVVGQDNHVVTGVYTATLNPDTMEFTVQPDRDNQVFTHFNWTRYIGLCQGGCLNFSVLEVLPDGWLRVAYSLENPINDSAFDPRIVIADPRGKVFTDYDGLTKLWPETGTTYKPFYALGKQFPNREIPGLFKGLGIFRMQFRAGSKLDTTIIVEASIGQNVEEPYEIISLGIVDGELTPNGTTTATIACTVNDWQDDVDYVHADLSSFINSIADMVWDAVDMRWEFEFSNENHKGIGVATFLLEAHSPNVWNISAYNWMTVHITEDPIIPDDYLVYTKNTDIDVYEAYKISIDGLDDVALTAYSSISTVAGFSADFTKVIFNSDYADLGYPQAFVMDIDGMNETYLGNFAVVGANTDGTLFLLHDRMTQKIATWTLIDGFVMLPTRYVLDCALPALGGMIVYIADNAGSPDVFKCDIDGGNPVQLTNDAINVPVKENITVSDDGQFVAYNATDSDMMQDDMEIYLLDSSILDSQVNISNTSNDFDDTMPQLDGAGASLVFVQYDNGSGSANIMRYSEIDGVTAITTDSIDDSLVYNYPDVSSDGLWIVFEKFEPAIPASNIMFYDLTGEPPAVVPLTTDGISSMPYLSAN